MGDKLSDIALYEQLAQGGAGRDAILNPVTNYDTFSKELSSMLLGGVKTASNYAGNIFDVATDLGNSNFKKNVLAVKNDPNLSTTDKLIALAKVPFEDTASSPVDLLLGTPDATSKVIESIESDIEKDRQKNLLAKQYGGGGFGEFMAETVAAVPIMKFGAMSTTNNALKSGANKLGLSKAIGVDAIKNAGVFGSTEFALAKFYGKSDSEAVGNALTAAVIGGVGTPVLGVAKSLQKPLPTKTQQRDEIFDKLGLSRTKEAESIVDAKIDKPKQYDFKEPETVYHGSGVKIDEFDTGLTKTSTEGVEGVYFTNDKSKAKSYAKKDGFMHEVEIDSSKMYDPKKELRTFSKDEALNLGFSEKDLKYTGRHNWREKESPAIYELSNLLSITGSNKLRSFKQNTELMKKLGYDGMKIAGDDIVVFDKNKIKLNKVHDKDSELMSSLVKKKKPSLKVNNKSPITIGSLERNNVGFPKVHGEGVSSKVNERVLKNVDDGQIPKDIGRNNRDGNFKFDAGYGTTIVLKNAKEVTSPTHSDIADRIPDHIKSGFKKLLEVNSDVKFFDVKTKGDNDINLEFNGQPTSFPAFFSNTSRSIFLSGNSQGSKTGTVIHELVHATSNRALLDSPEFVAKAGLIKKDLENYVATNKVKLGRIDSYFMTNVDEFVSEGLSNPRIVELLNSIPSTRSSGIVKTLFDELIDGILKFAGINAERGSLLAELKEALDLEISLPIKSGIKSDSTVSGASKSDRRASGTNADKSVKKQEDILFDVVDPKAKPGQGIEGQISVPEVKRQKKYSKFLGVNGRIFTKDGNLLSTQGTSDQKASLKMLDKDTVTSAKDEVDKQLKLFDDDALLQESYGQTQAKFKNKKILTRADKEYNRLKYEKLLYRTIKSDTNLDVSVRSEAKQSLRMLDDIKIDRAPEATALKLKREIEIKDFKAKTPSNIVRRETDLKDEYQSYLKSLGNKDLKDTKGTYDVTSSEGSKKLVDTIESGTNKANFVNAIKSLRVKEKLQARDFDYSKISTEQRRKYKDEVKVIDDYLNSKIDIHQFKKGNISAEELRYRAKRRIDDSLVADAKTVFKTNAERKEYVEDVINRYSDIGIYHKGSIKTTKPKDKTGESGSSDETKSKREADEVDESKKVHYQKMKHIRKYRSTGENPRISSKASGKAGQRSLSENTIRDIEQGILSDIEIANKISPIGTKSGRADLIKSATELANKKVTLRQSKELGITGRIALPESISFKDSVVDASNSIMQIATVLLGNKSMADMAKLSGKNIDVREVIGKQMSNAMGFNVTKSMVKPVFMTKNYGQGDKGLIRNLMEANKSFDEDTAVKFLDEYYKAENSLFPEFVKLQNYVNSRIAKGRDPEISWKLPDGFEVKLNLKRKDDGTISFGSKDIPVKVESLEIDEASRAVMVNIIHSVDAYVARRMEYASNHDSFVVKKGNETIADARYGKIMAEVNDSNLLNDILGDIGLSRVTIEKTLTKEDIMNSPYKLSVEHSAGKGLDKAEYEDSLRKLDLSKSGSKMDVMKDFMASGNVRRIQTNLLVDSLVNESSYRTMSKALSNDDVFERQVALAHQSPFYNKELEIDVPDGIDSTMWNKAQRDIFKEARAKLEYNPLLRDTIQGERKYFTDRGRIVGDELKPMYDEFMFKAVKRNDNMEKVRDSEDNEVLNVFGKDFKESKKKVDNISDSKLLSEDETNAKAFVNEASEPAPEVMKTETLNSTLKYMKDQHTPTKQSKAFTRLFNINKPRMNEVNHRAEKLYNKFKELMKKEDNALWTKHILDTDYHSIRNFDEGLAKEFMENHKDVYLKGKVFIDKAAEALNNDAKKVGAYMNNAKVINDHIGLGRQYDYVTDKLISIKAMTPDAWKFIEAKKDTELFDLTMDVLHHNRVQSAKLFGSNPDSFIKGYVREYYDSGKQIVGQDILWDAEQKVNIGAVPSTKEAKKIGKVTDFAKEATMNAKKFDSLEDKLKFAEDNSLRITPKGFRLVQNEKLRNEAGRSNDFARLITETSHSIDEKAAGRLVEEDILKELTLDDSLISTKQKPNFREITMNERDSLPYSLQGKVRWVHEDYYDRIMGRDEVRLVREGKDVAGENQRLKILDRILADFAGMFKQNVVLKNISSFKNAILVNQTLGGMAGVTPIKSFKLHREALEQIKSNSRLREKMAIMKARGRDTSGVEARLNKSELYQMEQMGLALNQLEGVRGDSTLLSHMLSELTGGKLDRLANEVFLMQGSIIGKHSARLFSTIDTQGRYTLAKQFMEDGLSMQEAVTKANGLFGDMDQMAPALIEAFDKYGAMPFLKWFSRTTPQLIRLSQDNPKKTIMLGISLYALSEKTNTNFSSVNPIEAMVDFADNAISLDYMEAVSKHGFNDATYRKMLPYVVPNLWQDIDRTLTDVGDEYSIRIGTKRSEFNPLFKDRIKKPWSDEAMDYRGFTQRIFEGK